MSVCPAKGSRVLWPHLLQRHGGGLRYVAFVEIMAAALRNDFFTDVVGSTIAKSFYGWGLDVSHSSLHGGPGSSGLGAEGCRRGWEWD